MLISVTWVETVIKVAELSPYRNRRYFALQSSLNTVSYRSKTDCVGERKDQVVAATLGIDTARFCQTPAFQKRTAPAISRMFAPTDIEMPPVVI